LGMWVTIVSRIRACVSSTIRATTEATLKIGLVV